MALSGFLILPDVPEISNPWYLTKDEVAFARKRMEYEGREPRGPYTKSKLIKIFSSWKIYALTLLYVYVNTEIAQYTISLYFKLDLLANFFFFFFSSL